MLKTKNKKKKNPNGIYKRENEKWFKSFWFENKI